MADRNIKVDAAETLREIDAIAETVMGVAVAGPVPQASGKTPIDIALAAVADKQQAQAEAWAATLKAMVPEQHAKSTRAVQWLESTEEHNSAEIARVYPESGGAGIQDA
jgi:L-2-hydroxyglutarate oxidase LhgO